MSTLYKQSKHIYVNSKQNLLKGGGKKTIERLTDAIYKNENITYQTHPEFYEFPGDKTLFTVLGSDIVGHNARGQTSLYLASRKLNFHNLRLLFSAIGTRDWVLSNATNANGDTPLFGLFWGFFEKINEPGANINKLSETLVEMALYLINKRANINADKNTIKLISNLSKEYIGYKKTFEQIALNTSYDFLGKNSFSSKKQFLTLLGVDVTNFEIMKAEEKKDQLLEMLPNIGSKEHLAHLIETYANREWRPFVDENNKISDIFNDLFEC